MNSIKIQKAFRRFAERMTIWGNLKRITREKRMIKGNYKLINFNSGHTFLMEINNN